MEVNVAGALTQIIPVEEGTQVGQVRRDAVALAQANGFDEGACGRVALVATELGTNLLNHGGGGLIQLCSVAGRDGIGVELCALDQGPGFVLADCLPDGYSTGSTPGNGLGVVQRHAALLDAYSDRTGAVVLARVYANASATPDLPYGAIRLPLHSEVVCGDAWHMAIDAQRVTVTMIDGLGHGPGAADAADAGTRIAASASGEPDERLARMHAGMSGSRGGATAVMQFDGNSGQVRFAGVGNIAAALCDGDGVRGMPSHPGIVGVQFRRAKPFDFPQAAGKLLVLHSDGLQTRWNLRDHAGLLSRHPRIIAAVLLRDYARGRDDACIFVMRLGGMQ
ncbi:transcriptional regulator [Xanthomonas vesicatoria ATCC 35937]|uniref:Stage II sporulation protein E (SpoIIE) n=1 Tax=Xanthomonas vesicatoria ATCC 35937 TaxID=925775 RepID=F0BAE0_9XANT|nr:ATP-binding protein [Xanthomonas vesicatoria]APP77069.1 transcriptional regulator [Xanthomonas vesicatoria ATCC 35937]EGD10590.1 Stage II sporulation protein E (SpoIIE) [Xanthomonas vesicatoria ATCC 35937]KTF32470.1 transcriptional regulator [Xanthomonas vesicatoria]MCC8596668.1 ATP-binding protein [Xanthomonas vesicatoria]MCC8605259.1 ATP-binding protein [Xanthomonas vesicatoria]